MKTIRELGLNRRKKEIWDGEKAFPLWIKRGRTDRKRIHLAGLGDVGRNVSLGLTLLGEDTVERIGLYDLDEAQCKRMETELSQIAGPPGGQRIPKVEAVSWEYIFNCDVFLFCATKSVPALDSGVRDVRMAQYEANRKIVSLYAREAARVGYEGLFVVISDPVDLLCVEALQASWEEKGRAAKPLKTNQICGCGLGVMNARALYYAQRYPEFAQYLKEGRAFGPHGSGLVLANSQNPAHYDDSVSRKLTELAVGANMEVRALGFKPYLAPAISSAVFSVLAILRGEWNYSAVYLNGLYFGALNKHTEDGIVWETDLLPDGLFERLEEAFDGLEEILWSLS